MKVLLAHPGTQHSYHLAKQLQINGVLAEFHTCIAFGNDSFILNFLKKVLPEKGKLAINSRIVHAVPNKRIFKHWLPEINFLFRVRKKGKQANEHDFFLRNKQFQENISNQSIQASDVVIGFDTSSWILAERAKKMGKKFILDVSIGHPLEKEKIFAELRKSYPEWVRNIEPKNKELMQIEMLEMQLADIVVVPSSFVRQSYINNGIAEEKIFINPFGTELNQFKFDQKRIKKSISFLFFGGLTARKGLPVLLEAWEDSIFLNHQLVLAGFGEIPTKINLPSNVINKGKINKKDRQQLFEESDVFVFPSFFEGFAQVQIEASSSGLPVITTINAGGNEIIEDGINGFVIETGNVESLKQAMMHFINYPESLVQMSANARIKALNFSWESYGERCVEILNNIKL